MTREKADFGHKAPDVQFCQGYLDEHNHWNNGFLCPVFDDGQESQYCCGTDTHRYCCIYDIHKQESRADQYAHIYIIIGLVISVSILILISTVLGCYFIKCCPLYKRRKRYHQDYIVYDDNDVSTLTNGQGNIYISDKDSQPAYPCVELKNIHESNQETPLNQTVKETNPSRGCCVLRNPVALATERDSGCYVSPTEYDSHTCLTNYDSLNEEALWASQSNNTARYSWPVRNLHEDVIPTLSERSETVEDVRRSSLSELCVEPRQTRV